MQFNKWTYAVALCAMSALIGCGDDPDDNPDKPGDNGGGEYGGGDNGGGKSGSDNDGAEYAEWYLDQNWNHSTRMEWWYTSQGSRVVPYDWYLALEQSGSEELVRSSANMQRLRFIEWPADKKYNPDGLPIGFVKDHDEESGESYFGFTCAACHTGKIAFKDADGELKEAIIEGGPAHSDFDKFVTEIGESLEATRDDDEKFARFAKAVLGDSAEGVLVDALKAELEVVTANLTARTKVNKPPHPNGYARLDAFGNIFNEGSVFAIDEPENAKKSDAPVSYPVVWDTPQHEVVQWNGAAVNAGIGPYTRNIGEVVGVFGDLRVHKVKTRILGTEKMRYEHHVDVGGLERLEEILVELWSPEWPEEKLGKLDAAKVAAGKAHYDNHCIKCHAVIADRTDPNRKIGEQMHLVAALGTDPLAATNPATSMSKTGILEGQTVLPLLKVLPAKGLLGGKFEAEAKTASVVGNGVIGIIREERPKELITGLLAYVKAAKALKPKEPSYKARPLNGIWASAPFLHNGSVPNLTELLKKPEDRVKNFYVGSWEMDTENVGFSTEKGEHTSEFDTSIPGNSNLGHDNGTDLTDAEKSELIEYIKSL